MTRWAASTSSCAGWGAGQHALHLHERQRPAERRARHGRQAHRPRSRRSASRWWCATRRWSSAEAPKTIEAQTLTLDFAASILDICGAEPLPEDAGPVVEEAGRRPATRTGARAGTTNTTTRCSSPTRPTSAALRTDEWKYIRYPHGDGSPDRHMAELYNLKADPEERHNLIKDAKHAELRQGAQRGTRPR